MEDKNSEDRSQKPTKHTADILPAEKNLRFQVAYTISEYWHFPEINDEQFDWDGEEQVKQTMYGVLNARQFLWLVLAKGLTKTISTQGMQIESGHIIPAVDFYDADEQSTCFVSVYTDEMMKIALSKSQKPIPTPVVQNDFSVKHENISFAAVDEIWDKMVEVLPEIVGSLRKEVGSYCIDDDDLDQTVPKLIEKLQAIAKSKSASKENISDNLCSSVADNTPVPGAEAAR